MLQNRAGPAYVFQPAKHVRLIVDKKILVFMIVLYAEVVCVGEESVYAF